MVLILLPSIVFSLNLIQLYPKILHSDSPNICLFTGIRLIAETQAHLRNRIIPIKLVLRTNLKVLPLFIYYSQLSLIFPFVILKAFTQYLLQEAYFSFYQKEAYWYLIIFHLKFSMSNCYLSQAIATIIGHRLF